MASDYYSQSKVKSDLNITVTTYDTQLDNWSYDAESEINDLLYSTASKMRRIASLPVLPFAAGSVPQSVQAAADHGVIARYYEFIRNLDLAKYHKGESRLHIESYIGKLKTEKRIYSRIVR